MKTVDQVISRFRRHYPGCDYTTALDLFQTAFKRLLDRAEFRTSDVTFNSIVADQREYAWAEADLRCYGVTWYKSASDFRPLLPTSQDQLRDRDGVWEARSSGEPRSFYLAARSGSVVLGFDPAPDESTGGGYPKAICHCESHSAISGSTTIPYSVLDEMYFVYAMCEFWAYEEDIAKAQIWERKRIQEESLQIEHLKGLIPTQETVLLPAAGVLSTRIR
jgi:hypothetical protein